jgi:hypothetical protein
VPLIGTVEGQLPLRIDDPWFGAEPPVHQSKGAQASKDADGPTAASGSTGANRDGSTSSSDLKPGSYTCTVDIDPKPHKTYAHRCITTSVGLPIS